MSLKYLTGLGGCTIKGYSGDKVFFKDGVIYKTTSKDPARILHQAHKQMKYRGKLLQSPLRYAFDVPKVLDLLKNGYTMEYVNGYSIIDVIERGDFSTMRTIINNTFDLIDWEFKQSVKRLLPVTSFITKLSDECPKEFRLHLINCLNKNTFRLLPTGICHGDLTFANMIFGDKIYLIDHLSPFVRTPYQDIGKLLQDVNLKWSLQMMDKPVDTIKVDLGYEYLKRVVEERISKYNKDLVHIFYFMTLCRLFPYTTDTDMYNLIYKECERLI
jgi:tRNA A-37 threonylcarbamoyl transferase component Bud32